MAKIGSQVSVKEPTLPGAGTLIVNSTALYALAFILATTLHELGHALVAMYYKLGPTLHDHWVEYAHRGTPRQEMFVAAGGPPARLGLGYLFFRLFRAQDGIPTPRPPFLAW